MAKSGTGTWGLGCGTRVWDVGRVGWDTGTRDVGTWGRGAVGTWGRGDGGTWRLGDVGTRGREDGNVGTGTWGCANEDECVKYNFRYYFLIASLGNKNK